jgi:hypothetical protein
MARSPVALGSLCFGFFLVANPAYFISCSDSGGFQYDEADMLEVVEQLNDTEHLVIDSPSELRGYQVDFQLEQSSEVSSELSAVVGPTAASWIESAHACGERTFVKAAGACGSFSNLYLEGTVRIKDGEDVVKTLEVRGAMEVHSNLLTEAQFGFGTEGVGLGLVWTDEGGGTFSGVDVQGDLDLPPLDSGLGGAGGGRAD